MMANAQKIYALKAVTHILYCKKKKIICSILARKDLDKSKLKFFFGV